MTETDKRQIQSKTEKEPEQEREKEREQGPDRKWRPLFPDGIW